MRGARKRRERDNEDLGKEEIERVIRGMKDEKAAGMDGIASELWKYGEEGIRDWVWGFCNKVWRGEGWLSQMERRSGCTNSEEAGGSEGGGI